MYVSLCICLLRLKGTINCICGYLWRCKTSIVICQLKVAGGWVVYCFPDLITLLVKMGVTVLLHVARVFGNNFSLPKTFVKHPNFESTPQQNKFISIFFMLPSRSAFATLCISLLCSAQPELFRLSFSPRVLGQSFATFLASRLGLICAADVTLLTTILSMA